MSKLRGCFLFTPYSLEFRGHCFGSGRLRQFGSAAVGCFIFFPSLLSAPSVNIRNISKSFPSSSAKAFPTSQALKISCVLRQQISKSFVQRAPAGGQRPSPFMVPHSTWSPLLTRSQRSASCRRHRRSPEESTDGSIVSRMKAAIRATRLSRADGLSQPLSQAAMLCA